ncbi:phage prohead protein [Mycoplasma miroungigenitalium]|uniref:Phage prohead protein n=1 Tax=Mycoplasma miroungigenitalium TaxID=754515 RepID=A0A6M4J9L1_9MOLU|nr:HK97 family phage prohead protease [Mycoplasma miroungigenitalium]QJR43630.1 phage prohead protein [Mycoplasma miroungigenitalium]
MNNKKLVYFSQISKNEAVENDGSKTIEMTVELDSWSPVYTNILGSKYREKIALDAFDFEQPLEAQNINSYLDHKMSIEYLLASTKNKSMSVQKDGNKIVAKIKSDPNNSLLNKVEKWIAEGVVESNSFIFESLDTEFREVEGNPELDYEVVYKRGKLLSIDPVYAGFFPQNNCRVYSQDRAVDVAPLDAFIEAQNKKQQEKEMEKIDMTDIEKEKQIEAPEINKDAEKIVEMNNTINELKACVESLKTEHKDRSAFLKSLATQNAPEVKNSDLTDQEFITLKSKSARGEKLSASDKLKMFNKSIDFLSDGDKKELELISKNIDLQKRALDATTDLKGLALIETTTMPGILTEINAIFPEFTEYTQKLNLTGLDEVSKSIYVPAKQSVTATAEGASLPDFGGQTFKVKLSPKRYGWKLKQNNALSNGDDAWAAQIADAKNSIWRGLRHELYAGLFKHAGTAFNASTYTGGFTLEAKRTTATTNKFTFDDLEVVLKDLIAKYGDGVLAKYVIAMHPSTLNALEVDWAKGIDDARKKLYDPVARTYRGVPILISDDYPDDTIEKGKKVAAIFAKDSLLAYGLSITVAGDPYSELDKDMSVKIIQTRGEIKLIDPHVNSRYVEVK